MANSSGQSNQQKNQGSMRVPPQSIDSERAVLGAVMLRPTALQEIEDIISAEAFYVDKHRIIFKTMQDLAARHEPIDVLSLSHSLKEKKQLESIGGNAYLAELTQTVPASTNAKYYAEIVNKKYILRSLIDASEYISDSAFNEGQEEIDDVLDKAEKKIFEITSTPKGQKFISMKDELVTAMERIERLHENRGELRGVPTGFKSLDNMLAGFQKSDLIILAARPSVGKTSLALDIARMTAIKHGTPVGIFSLEMDSQQLVDRMLAAEAKVNAWQLRTGNLPHQGNEFSALATALDTLSKAPIYINDDSSSSISKMRAFARRLKAEHGLGLIIVDYLQLMTTSKSYDNMVNQVTEISRSLKGLARDLEVPVLALSQLSRAVESRGGKPRLSDLRDSGSIEQDADVVMFIHREIDQEKGGKLNAAEIMIEKHRNGPTGKVDLFFDDKYTTFVDPEEGHGYDKMAEQAKSKAAGFGAF